MNCACLVVRKSQLLFWKVLIVNRQWMFNNNHYLYYCYLVVNWLFSHYYRRYFVVKSPSLWSPMTCCCCCCFDDCCSACGRQNTRNLSALVQTNSLKSDFKYSTNQLKWVILPNKSSDTSTIIKFTINSNNLFVIISFITILNEIQIAFLENNLLYNLII